MEAYREIDPLQSLFSSARRQTAIGMSFDHGKNMQIIQNRTLPPIFTQTQSKDTYSAE